MTGEEMTNAMKIRDKSVVVAENLVNMFNADKVDPQIAILGMSLVLAQITHDGVERKEILAYINGAINAALADMDLNEEVTLQ